MMPSAEQMLEAAQQALRDFVVPVAADDQWAASALRSVDLILSHLQARVPVEGPMLHSDSDELAVLLDQAAAALDLGGIEASEGGPLDVAIAGFVEEAGRLLDLYAPVADLAALNMRGRLLVDDLLLVCHAAPNDADAVQVHADLRAYLMRHLERETPFFFPTFVGRPV